MFPITSVHLEYIESSVNAFGEVFIHGDGNLFPDAELSKQHIQFAPPKLIGHDYVLRFKAGDKLPESVEELQSMFIAAKTKENAENLKPTQQAKIYSIPDKKKQAEPVKQQEKKSKK